MTLAAAYRMRSGDGIRCELSAKSQINSPHMQDAFGLLVLQGFTKPKLTCRYLSVLSEYIGDLSSL
jgi:hypothetical protein